EFRRVLFRSAEVPTESEHHLRRCFGGGLQVRRGRAGVAGGDALVICEQVRHRHGGGGRRDRHGHRGGRGDRRGGRQDRRDRHDGWLIRARRRRFGVRRCRF